MNRRDRGQAAVEFALAVPLVIFLVLGVVQVLVVAARQLTLEQLARTGARAASAAADASAGARSVVDDASALEPVRVDVVESGGRVTVTVTYVERTTVPLIGRLIGDVELTAHATMGREPP